jgi:hypothetical protein
MVFSSSACFGVLFGSGTLWRPSSCEVLHNVRAHAHYPHREDHAPRREDPAPQREAMPCGATLRLVVQRASLRWPRRPYRAKRLPGQARPPLAMNPRVRVRTLCAVPSAPGRGLWRPGRDDRLIGCGCRCLKPRLTRSVSNPWASKCLKPRLTRSVVTLGAPSASNRG